ncbi:hypothetical protein DPEC_G00192150 [Dallia pectoralis]|uniref:Uncharacterized protein n=1 Tax=Dallia pectoralis TaxID=75939 RepID=A0ACC2GBX2_DALPE|nr:hypothetical protein DPEC_G00192150 [Dallia pectoralis]
MAHLLCGTLSGGLARCVVEEVECGGASAAEHGNPSRSGSVCASQTGRNWARPAAGKWIQRLPLNPDGGGAASAACPRADAWRRRRMREEASPCLSAAITPNHHV